MIQAVNPNGQHGYGGTTITQEHTVTPSVEAVVATIDTLSIRGNEATGISHDYRDDSHTKLVSSFGLQQATTEFGKKAEEILDQFNNSVDTNAFKGPLTPSHFTDLSKWDFNNCYIDNGRAILHVEKPNVKGQAYLRLNVDAFLYKGTHFLSLDLEKIADSVELSIVNYHDHLLGKVSGDIRHYELEFDVDYPGMFWLGFRIDDAPNIFDQAVVIDAVTVHKVDDYLVRYLKYLIANFK